MKYSLLLITAALSASLALPPGIAQSAPVSHTFTTNLEEVRTGHFNGREYLSIQIPGDVGPANCRGNVLKINVESFKSEDKQDAIEKVALSAMLNEDPVQITVPLGYADCIDGKPTVLDMYLMSDQ